MEDCGVAVFLRQITAIWPVLPKLSHAVTKTLAMRHSGMVRAVDGAGGTW